MLEVADGSRQEGVLADKCHGNPPGTVEVAQEWSKGSRNITAMDGTEDEVRPGHKEDT